MYIYIYIRIYLYIYIYIIEREREGGSKDWNILELYSKYSQLSRFTQQDIFQSGPPRSPRSAPSPRGPPEPMHSHPGDGSLDGLFFPKKKNPKVMPNPVLEPRIKKLFQCRTFLGFPKHPIFGVPPWLWKSRVSQQLLGARLPRQHRHQFAHVLCHSSASIAQPWGGRLARPTVTAVGNYESSNPSLKQQWFKLIQTLICWFIRWIVRIIFPVFKVKPLTCVFFSSY